MRHLLTVFAALILVGCLVMAEEGNGVLSKYTYIPGEKQLLAEDFSSTTIGEVPLSLAANGNAEIIVQNNERWLMAEPSTEFVLPIRSKVEDLTLEFLLKTNEQEGEFDVHLVLENESQGYEGNINFGRETVGWNGYDGKGDLPFNNIETPFYKTGQVVPVALTIQKGRVKLYINKILAMSVAGFARIMPQKLTIRVNHNSEEIRYFKDLRLATGVPDIAADILQRGKYTSHGVYFDTGSSKVKDNSHAVLKAVADILSGNPDLKILIVGYTDNVGDKQKNLHLSQERADSVKSYLVSQFKADPARIQTAGKGDGEPIADNKTAEGRAVNRRVDFVKS